MKITRYFSILNQIELYAKENHDLRERLHHFMNKVTSNKTPSELPKISKVLSLLLDNAIKNAGRKTGGERYDDVIKEISHTFYHIGGLQNYELMSLNFKLPSVSTVRRVIYSHDPVIEGEFRISQLKTFLIERNLPLRVYLCEDATVLAQRIQYHSNTNQIKGFSLPLDENGLPMVDAFPATSAAVISDYFKNNDKSRNIYCIIARPLAVNAPSFVLSVFGTNNKFKAKEVHMRLQWTRTALSREDIHFEGLSADGDGRLLKCMLFYTISTPSSWPWFNASKKVPFFCVQDPIHVGTKLKSRFLKPSIILPLGKTHVVSRGHLIELIEKHQLKGTHLLCMSDINPKDKMNFKGMQRMYDVKVTELLTHKVQGSEGTALYLNMIREVVECFTLLDLEPLKRVEIIWKWIFFLRFWREWVLVSEGYTLESNFLTSNAYQCIEVNGHALIQAIIKFRDTEDHNLFLPWLFSSQHCEDKFRELRASAVSFSTLEMLNMLRRIDTYSETYMNLQSSDILKFPRHQKSFKHSSNSTPFIPTSLPEDYEMERSVLCSLQEATSIAIKFGLVKKRTSALPIFPPFRIRSISELDMEIINQEIDEDDVGMDLEMDGSTNVVAEIADVTESALADVVEDLLIVSSRSLGLKNFDVAKLTDTCPFVAVLDGNGQQAVIKKSTLCWLLSSNDTKVSSERLLRVQADHPSLFGSTIYQGEPRFPTKEDFVCVGDWCAFTENGKIVIGRVLAFEYLTGSSRKNREFSARQAPTSAPEQNARGLGCLCSWFSVQQNLILSAMNMDVHGYFDLKFYVCTVPRPRLVEGNQIVRLKLPCQMKDIRRFLV